MRVFSPNHLCRWLPDLKEEKENNLTLCYNIMNLFAFILISFVVGFVADIVLNDLSKSNKTFVTLRPYYADKSIFYACFLSGVIIAIGTGVLMVAYKMLTKSYLPSTFSQIVMFLAVGYVVGYLLDVAIDKFNILGESIKPFYKAFGSGHSGAIAFEVALVATILTAKYVLPYCCN